jgi:hypothetical protein
LGGTRAESFPLREKSHAVVLIPKAIRIALVVAALKAHQNQSSSFNLAMPFLRYRIGVSMKEKIRKWYEGEFIPYENAPDSTVLFVGGDHKRHWTAKLARWVIEFYMREWKWTLGAVATVIGAFVFKKF